MPMSWAWMLNGWPWPETARGAIWRPRWRRWPGTGAAPAIAFQLLIYPVSDADFDTPSCLENAEGYFLTRKSMQWFWDHYAPDLERRKEPYAAPLLGKLEGLPPALVQTAEFDPLRDEGEAYAEALRAAGCEVELTRYDGLIHGYFGMQAAVAASRRAMRQACGALASHLG